MIHPDEALALIESFIRQPALEEVDLSEALGRYLPVRVLSSIDQPPFAKSAMDGWAWNEDGNAGGNLLRIRGTIAAGRSEKKPLGKGECDRIMTGAPLPPGASRVQRVEWSEESNGFVTFTKCESESNVIARGENLRAGAELLGPRLLRAQDVAILAADGRRHVSVAAKPLVRVFSTGAELAERGTALAEAMIYDSNRPQLISQLGGMPCTAIDCGILPDDAAKTAAAIRESVDSCDVLIFSGGVSMGDFDFVPSSLKECGVKELFHGVSMKPGKPTFFGRSEKTFVFGLPGNPVSVFVNTEVFVKPLLAALSGIVYAPATVPCPLSRKVERRNADRVEFLPVRFDAVSGGVEAVDYGGSSALQALALADGFIRLEMNQKILEKGSMTNVRLVR